MQQCTINHIFGNKIYGMINMEAIPKFDSKSVLKFDISTKPTTWIGHKPPEGDNSMKFVYHQLNYQIKPSSYQ